MRDREKLLNTIRALMAKTTERGCTEEEMLASFDKAAALKDAYGVTDEDLQLSRKEGAIFREQDDPSDPHGIRWRLGNAVGEFCGVTIFRKQRKLAFVGGRADCDLAEFLLDHLQEFVHAELYKHLLGCLAPRSERRTVIRNFVEGCTIRISDRMEAACRRSKAARTSNGRALAVVQSHAITDKLKELGIKLEFRRGYAGNFDQAAFDAGKRAGDSATFGRPVEGKAGALRIGKG
jgi:hypothetical protein